MSKIKFDLNQLKLLLVFLIISLSNQAVPPKTDFKV